MLAALVVLAVAVPVAATVGYLAGIWRAGRRLPATLARLNDTQLRALAQATKQSKVGASQP